MLQSDTNIKNDAIVFTYKAGKPIRKIYAPKINPVILLTDYQNYLLEGMPGIVNKDFKTLIEKTSEFYIIESGNLMPDDDIKSFFSGFVEEQGAKSKGFGLKKIQTYTLDRNIIKLQEYPLDVYKIVKK